MGLFSTLGTIGGGALGMSLGGPVGAGVGGRAGSAVGGLFERPQVRQPSPAEAQLRMATDRNIAAAHSLAFSGVHGPGSALHAALNAQTQAQQQAAGQMAELRAREQFDAQNRAVATRGQNLGIVGSVLGGGAALGQTLASAFGGGAAPAAAPGVAPPVTSTLQSGMAPSAPNLNQLAPPTPGVGPLAQDYADQQGIPGDMQPGVRYALSDKRQKTNIHGGDHDAETLMDALRAASFEYKDPRAPGAAPGPQTGVMAQDVEKGGPAGRQMVHEGPEGKSLDPARALSAILASLANLHGRLRSVEGR